MPGVSIASDAVVLALALPTVVASSVFALPSEDASPCWHLCSVRSRAMTVCLRVARVDAPACTYACSGKWAWLYVRAMQDWSHHTRRADGELRLETSACMRACASRSASWSSRTASEGEGRELCEAGDAGGDDDDGGDGNDEGSGNGSGEGGGENGGEWGSDNTLTACSAVTDSPSRLPSFASLPSPVATAPSDKGSLNACRWNAASHRAAASCASNVERAQVRIAARWDLRKEDERDVAATTALSHLRLTSGEPRAEIFVGGGPRSWRPHVTGSTESKWRVLMGIAPTAWARSNEPACT